MIIKNAVIHTVTNGTVENGYIEFDEKIISLGDMKDCPQGEAYDAKGAALYPGFIDAHTHIGISEDSLTFEGEDCNEMTDPVTPNLRVLDGVNALDRCFEEAREAGVTCVLTCPGSANPIAGQIAAIKTYGVCVDDMIVKAPAAMKFALGENPKTVYNEKKMAPSTRMATAAIIREQLTKTLEYINKDKGSRDFDAKLDALAPLFEEHMQMHIHAHRADDRGGQQIPAGLRPRGPRRCLAGVPYLIQQQIVRGHAEQPAQRDNILRIRHSPAALPLGQRLPGHMDLPCQLLLTPAPGLPQFLQLFSEGHRRISFRLVATS